MADAVRAALPAVMSEGEGMQVRDSTERSGRARGQGANAGKGKQCLAPAAAASEASGSIAERQNSPRGIQLLAAQRQLYSEAKCWRRLGAWSVMAVAITGVAATLVAPELLKVIGPIGVLVGIAQWAVSLVEKQRAKTAANIQEQFDTFVYPLAWNPVLGAKADAEDVIAAAARYKGDRAKLANWYSLPDGVPDPLDVLLCQRTNLRWDATLRQAYANTVLASLVGLFLIILVAGIVRSLSLGEFLLAMLPSVGSFRLGLDTVHNHRQHSAAQLELKRKVEAAWEKAQTKPRAVPKSDLRAIQDGIYQLRVVAPPVPDGFYWKKRDQFEQEIRLAVEQLWREAETAGRSSGRNPSTR